MHAIAALCDHATKVFCANQTVFALPMCDVIKI